MIGLVLRRFVSRAVPDWFVDGPETIASVHSWECCLESAILHWCLENSLSQ